MCTTWIFSRDATRKHRALSCLLSRQVEVARTSVTDVRRGMRFSFVGDGHYCGDGGAELQRLWQLHPWKPIGGCDGRFVLRSEVLSACSLQDLCRDWQIATCTPVLRCCEAERDEGADAADCVRFVGGGAVGVEGGAWGGRGGWWRLGRVEWKEDETGAYGGGWCLRKGGAGEGGLVGAQCRRVRAG